MSTDRSESGSAATGICLSGGGIRAAAFGLGALQVLQDRLQLLRGRNPAAWLSAVSGGSYSAAAYTLVNAGSHAQLVVDAPPRLQDPMAAPFSEGTEEFAFLRANVRYLLAGGAIGVLRTVCRFVIRLVANVLCLAAVLYVAALFTGLSAGFGGALDNQLPEWAHALLAFNSIIFIGVFLRLAYSSKASGTSSGAQRLLMAILPIAVVIGLGVPTLLRTIESVDLLREPSP